MANIAIIEKNRTNVDYSEYFDFEYDRFALCDKKVKRVTKKDITLDFDDAPYDYVILVGADPAKHIAKISSIVKYQGFLIDNKYLPLTNPAMLLFKPEGRGAFNKAVDDIKGYINGVEASKLDLNLISIDDEDEAYAYISHVISEQPDFVSLDSETSALYCRDGYILGFSLSYKENEGVYISADACSDEVLMLCQKLWNTTKVVFHNAKFDFSFFSYHFTWYFPDWEDTMLLHYCLNEQTGTHDLKSLAIKYTNLGDYDKSLDEYKRQYCKDNKILLGEFTYDLVPFNIMYKYAATDSVATFLIFKEFYNKVLNSTNLARVYLHLLKPGTELLYKIQDNGVPFSLERLEAAQIKLSNDIDNLENKLYTYKELHAFEKSEGKIFNPNSPAQVRKLFFDYLSLPIPDKRTGTGAISTDAEVLEGLSKIHPIPKLVWDIKKAKKIKSTYIDKIIIALDMDSRLRTWFNLTTTTSGRLSSSGKLNMQQLPRGNYEVKGSIKAKEGWKIVSGDLGTAEMWAVACMSGDKTLQKMFVDKVDYHGAMAVLKFGLSCHPNEVKALYPDKRNEAKTISFEILYKLNLREPALKNFPVLKKWLVSKIEEVKRNGYIYQFFGRKRRVPNVFSSNNEIASHEIRSAINALVQGPASDINLLAAIDMQKYIEANNMKTRIFALVHDSILAEVPDEELEVYKVKLVEFMQKDRGLSFQNTPVSVDIEVGDDYYFKD